MMYFVNKNQIVYALAAVVFMFLLLQGILLSAIEFVFCMSIKYIPEQIVYMLIISGVSAMIAGAYIFYRFKNK